MKFTAAFRVLLAVIGLERGAFYGMLALLAVFLKHVGHPNPAGAVATLTAAVYGLTFVGGYVGDRYSYRLTAAGGLLSCVAAYAALALGVPFGWWMPMLAIGIGLFKPVIPVMVGKTAPDGSAMQSGRMSKFYSWVNVGGFVGPLLLGWLYATISPRVAFMSAAVASLGALAVVLGGWNKLASVDVRNPVESLAGVRLDIEVPDAAADEPQAEIIWRIRKLLVLCALSVVFWVGYHAFFGPVALWLENTVNKKVWGFEIPTAWFQTINPALLILTGMLAPSLFAGWSLRSRVFAALAATVLGYFGLAMLSRWGVGVPLWSAVAVVLVVSVGELLISPLGLATVSALAPKKHTGAFMAIWYAASAIGGYLSGLMGNRAGALEFGVMAVAGLLGTIATVACWRLLGDFSVFQELQTHRARLINKISSRATAHQLINAPAVVEHPQ